MALLHSFDVFDTCLLRAVAFPSDVFVEIAKALKADLKPSLGADFAELFRSIRIEAERRTRSASHLDEVTLEEIWGQLQLMLPGIDAAKGIDVELDEEKRLLRPNLHVLAEIRMLRKSGVKITFTSDTYLPRKFIEGLLVQFDFAKQGDSFFVSSELRLTKHSGKLFTRLLEVEALLPADIIHTGDSEHSDVAVPRSMGIHAVHYAGSALHPAELALIGQAACDPSSLTALAGSMRIFRTNHGGTKTDVAASFTGAFLGPFLLTFASWLLARAQGDGIRRLYFLSRDCHLLFRVAEQLSGRFGGIECRYLQTSRQSLFLPTATGLSPSCMPCMRRAFERPVLRRLLAKLELDLSSTGPDMARLAGTNGANRILESDQDWAGFWHALEKEPVASRVKNLINTRRDAANAYFDAQGLNDGVRWALVDLGGQLTCQAAIQTIVRAASPTVQARGYYLALSDGRRPPCETGEASALFYAQPPDRQQKVAHPAVFHRNALLEHLLGCAPHGTVHHYEFQKGSVLPVFMEDPNAELGILGKLEAATIDFCKQQAHLAPSLSDTQTARHVIEQVTSSCFGTPEPEWVRFLAGLKACEDQNNIDAFPIVSPFTGKEVFAAFLPVRFRNLLLKDAPMTIWSEGRNLLSTKGTRTLLNIRKSLSRVARSALGK